MATNNPQPVEQKIIIRLENAVEKGRLVLDHLKQVEKSVVKTDKKLKAIIKTWAKLDKAYQKNAKQITKNLKLDKKTIASAKAQQKVHASTEKSLKKLRGEQKKLAAEATRTQNAMMKSAKAASAAGGGGGRAGSGGGGIGFGLPAFLSVTAITLAAKALASWTQQLGFAEAKAQALAGSFRNITDQLGDSRSQELFVRFAEQGGLSRRFSSKIEIEGLKQLREQLSKKLGDQFGSELALKLTASFGKSNKELTEFLSRASVDVTSALAAFESRDIENFATALSAVNQKSTELTKTAVSLESAWLEIKQTAELAFKSFLDKNGGDVQALIGGISDKLVEAINWTRQFGADWEPIFKFLFSSTKKFIAVLGTAITEAQLLMDSASGFIGSGNLDNRVDKRIIESNRIGSKIGVLIAQAGRAQDRGDTAEAERLTKAIDKLETKRQAILKGASAFLGVTQSVEPIAFKLANTIERIKREQEAATKAAGQQREQIERSLTPAQRLSLALENLQAPKALENLQLGLIESRLRAAVSSPVGFSDVFQAQIDAQGKVNDLLSINRREQELVSKLDLDRESNQKRLIELQIQENNLIAKRNDLLRSQTKGYLDAITAQAFGAGRFSKIILTQDKNVAKALEFGVAKANPFLGAVGDEASRVRVDPFRFTGDRSADQAALQKRAEQMKAFFKPFLDDLREIIVPQKQGQDIEVGRALRGRPRTHPQVQPPQVEPRVRRRSKVAKDGSNALKNLADAAKAAAPFLERLEGMDDVASIEIMRPTRSGGRTTLSGGGT